MSTIKDLKKAVESLESSLNNKLSSLEERLGLAEANIVEKQSGSSEKIQEDLLQIRNVVITNLLNENKNLRNKMRTLQSRMIDLERSVTSTQQNSRKNNLELDGIPDSISQELLIPTVSKIFNNLGVKCEESDIEVAHRLPTKKRPQPVIIRSKRNILGEVVKKRKNLSQAVNGIFPPNTKIYANDNLSPYMRTLAYNCRLLKNAEEISDCWTSNGVLKVKTLSDDVIKIGHEVDVFKISPQFEGFTFDKTFCNDMLSEENQINAYDDLAGH